MGQRWSLVGHDGVSRRVGPRGLVIGRQSDCDVVGSDPALSRRHAFVRVTSDGAEIVPLGHGVIEVNGKAIDRPTSLAHGDALALPGLALRVDLARDSIPDLASATPQHLVLERARGGTYGLAHSPFSIGGGANDDLLIADWPAGALLFHSEGGRVFVEPHGGAAAEHAGVALESGVRHAVSAGDAITYDGETFIVRAGTADAMPTASLEQEELPTAIAIEMLPRGGLIVFSMPSGDRTVYLADRRLELLIALLQPPEGHKPGDILSDDTLATIVWPRKTVGRTEINTLISRCRRDLVDVGLNGARLIQRAPGGGGTRFALARNAKVTVKQ